MRLFCSTLLFFITFYKISIINSYAYLILPIAGFCCFLLFHRPYRKYIMNALGLPIIGLIIYLLIQTFVYDVVSGSLMTNTTNTFFVRLLSLIIISLLPAFLFCKIITRHDYSLIIKSIIYAFYIQLFFWIITYLDPNLKIVLTKLMGGTSEAVNLREYNLTTRGFGLSQEINYTSPFMTVLVSLLFLKNNKISFLSAITQLVNSNLTLIAIFIGFAFSKVKLYLKTILISISIFSFLFLGPEFFPRLYAEFGTSESRTISALLTDHLKLTPTNMFEHAFGTLEYTFQSGSSISSDIGWVNMYNYGGILFIFEFIALLTLLAYRAFGKTWFTVVWIIIGCILNFKGLLFSPNSFYFFTFIAIFFRQSTGLPLQIVNRGS